MKKPFRRLTRTLALPVVVAAACVPLPPPPIEEPAPAIARIGLPEAPTVETLAVVEGGDLWLGGRDALLILDPHTGVVRMQRRLPTAAVPWRLADRGEEGEVILASAFGDLLRLADLDSSPSAHRPAADAPPLTVVSEDVHFDVLDNSAVYLLDRASLRRFRAWARLGATTTAAGASPEGDRLYQALEEGRGTRLLMRDVQTGRTLMEEELPVRVHSLVPGRGPRLYTIEGEGREMAVARRRPSVEGAPLRWSLRLRELQLGPDAVLRVAPSGEDLALVAPGEGVVLLSGADGRVLERWAFEALDAVFSRGGDLWGLEPGGVLRLRECPRDRGSC